MKKFLQTIRKNPKKVLMIVSICAFMCFMLAVTTSATSSGLENVGTVSTFLWSEIGQVVTTIVSTPLLLIPVGIFVAGAAIGLAKRFIGR